MPSLRPHLSYRKTDLPWLAQIPAHWEVKSLKYIKAKKKFAIVDGPFGTQLGTPDYKTEGIPLIRVGNLDYFGNLSLENVVFISEEKWLELQRSAIEPGDIVIAKTGATIGKSGVVPKTLSKALIASSCIKISLNREIVLPEFLTHTINTDDFQRQILDASGGSTRDTINIAPFSNLQIAIPSIPEQQEIANYLDRQTRKIDTLIAKKEHLLDLLAEQRAAIIRNAVTKGLNPDVKMKNSDAAWLGQVPSHWEVKRLGTVAPLLRGHDLTVAQRKEGTIPVYSSSGLAGFHNVAKAKGPGVITGRYGTIGKIYYSEHDFWPMNTSLYVYDFKGNYQRYIYYLLQILSFDAFTGKSAVPGVNRNDLHPLLVCQPPINEQEQIANYIDKQLVKFDGLFKKIETVIERLREYRAALISSAVTGKIDVR
jgi:type I restriction enzyme, S subunit